MTGYEKGRADLVLVRRGLVPSREKARSLIREKAVRLNGELLAKPSQTVPLDGNFNIEEASIRWVSRGGLKLEAALDAFDVPSLSGGVCLDVGASTGGFSDVLLSRGAAHIYAVDVGHGQLAKKLASDPRITNLEKTHARDLTRQLVPRDIDFIVCDLSFISITKALAPAMELARAGAVLITLIKPQFEAGRAALGKGGVVRAEADRQAAIELVRSFVCGACGWQEKGLICSPITGADGNIEYLFYAIKP
ncbi:MAG: TlyA family RNA methyltransferase [Alphaproteobacteria bacterium]|jgi:23S rRNA (cytidine1920-2'-O)/16S rRNA (cytidine1409-2'-O)-methyltransferase|nr:TlyA family RNA methyltransferase [Alphaproteobacteria bacterium]MBL6776699.1 TlyA family RNA methyltransferase [Alphaproteobacteria bacterium]